MRAQPVDKLRILPTPDLRNEMQARQPRKLEQPQTPHSARSSSEQAPSYPSSTGRPAPRCRHARTVPATHAVMALRGHRRRIHPSQVPGFQRHLARPSDGGVTIVSRTVGQRAGVDFVADVKGGVGGRG